MTTIDSAASWHGFRRFTLASLAVCMSFALSGCGTNTSIFNSGDSNALNLPSIGGLAGAPAANALKSKVAIAPVIGAPDNVGKQIQSQLTAALAQRNIGIAPATSTGGAAYTLRGYVVSAREAAGTKISYIWDVTDPTGKRVNRITGEELAPASTTRDPWQSVTPQITQAIASKTAGSLAAWLPTQTPATGPAVANNSANPTAGSQVTNAGNTPPPATTNGRPVQNAALSQGVGAGTGPVAALIPTVIGAPGDGGVSLTNAIQRELQRNGVGLASVQNGQNYTVEGKVNVGKGKSGKQPIQIDWHVKDPQGKKLGTVSQKNEIPEGSLDGAWGPTANAAAAAAAQGILKLLPKTNKAAAASQGTF